VPAWDVTSSVWDALAAAVIEQGGMPCGLGARDTLRTEMGYPLHGNDLSLDITPVMAGAAWAVGWDKPAFWGREALTAQRAAKESRLMRGLVVTGRGIPRSHCEVKDADGNVVGEVTSGTFSPTRKQGIALALLDRSVTLGDDVVIDVRGRDVAATVSKPPFVEVAAAYAVRSHVSSRPTAWGRRAAPRATHPPVSIWKGSQGPTPEVRKAPVSIERDPKRNPMLGPRTRPPRMSATNIGSTPAVPADRTRRAPPAAARTPRTATSLASSPRDVT
jgi:hypothetical protein